MQDTALPPEVESYIKSHLGDEVCSVATELSKLGRATDTVLADLLDKRTSQIRRALYALHEARVAEYREERDRSKGWLTFVWSLDPGHASTAISEVKAANAAEIKAEIKQLASEPHYACGCTRELVPMGAAVQNQFQCGHCGGVLAEADVPARIRELSKALAALRAGAA